MFKDESTLPLTAVVVDTQLVITGDAAKSVNLTLSPYPAATSGVLSVTAGNTCGTSAASTKAITVQPLQFIHFDSLSSTSYGGGAVIMVIFTVIWEDIDPTLNGTTSSGLPLESSSNNTRVATVNGDQINWLDSGTVTISAYQPGDSNYNPAGLINATVTVLKPVPIGPSIYPNPSRRVFYCATGRTFSAQSYAFYNSSGQCVVTAPVVEYPYYWALFHVRAGNVGRGIYVLKVLGQQNGKPATMAFRVMIL